MDELAARLDRVEAMLAIQQLPIRYALAVDGRDIDGWTRLFVDDVNCGRHGIGRAALRGMIEPALRRFHRSIHQICGHQIDLVDADHAIGKVYCRAEHEVGEHWIIMAICYFDSYERRGGEWLFTRRKERHWYAADQTRRPSGPDFYDWPGRDFAEPTLPVAFDSWLPFWEAAGGVPATISAYPVRPKA